MGAFLFMLVIVIAVQLPSQAGIAEENAYEPLTTILKNFKETDSENVNASASCFLDFCSSTESQEDSRIWIPSEMACTMDDFWSLDFWNNPVPIFSNCFKTTVSVLLPSAIFLLLAIYDVCTHTERRNTLNPRTFLLLARIVVSVILIFLSVCSFFPDLLQGGMEISFYDARFLGHFFRIFTNIAALCIVIKHINFGQTYSNSLSVYWILQSIAVLPFHATLIVEAYYQVSWRAPVLDFALEMVYYPLIYMQFFLSIFTSKHPYTPQRRSPMEEETMILFLTFHWLYKLIWLCKRKALLISNLFPLPLSLGITYIRAKVQKHLRGKRSDRSAYEMVDGTVKRTPEFKNFLTSLLKAFGWRLSCCLCLEIIDSVLTFVPSFILGWIIDHLSKPSRTWNGYLLCSLLVFTVFTCRCVWNLLMLQSTLYILQIKAALMDAVYLKALKMSCSARRHYSSGQLANLLSADVERVEKLASEVINILGAPLKICIAIGLMWYFLSSAWITALVIIIIVILASLVIGKRISKLQVEQMKIKDNRLKILTEIINCVKVIKLYAWETPFVELVNEIREKEVLFIRKQLLYYAGSSFIWGWAPFMIVCSSLFVFIAGQPNGLSISLVFVTIDVVNNLRYPLFSVSEITSVVAQACTSLKRLNRFFSSEEYDTDAIGSQPDDGHAITIKNARLTWDKPTEVLLKNIHMNIPKGSLVAIIGPVGSGKSSLLSSILGDMKILSGTVDYEGSIGYVPQEAWIMNKSLRDNILFYKDFDQQLYKNVISACCLQPDLDQLIAGDMTEIGEKGVNISGGQKQRISLARAVYRDADIYLLDDPLSAVDAHVGKSLFENVIRNTGLLKDKTRILVTHSLSVLPHVDKIYMMQDGTIKDLGSYNELRNNDSEVLEYIQSQLKQQEENQERQKLTDQDSISVADAITRSQEITQNGIVDDRRLNGSCQLNQVQRKLIEDEEMESNQVKLAVYLNYMRKCTVYLFLLAVAFYGAYQGFEIAAKYALTARSKEDIISLNSSVMNYTDLGQDRLNNTISHDDILQYMSFGIVQGLCVIFGNCLLAVTCTRASRIFHRRLIDSVIKAPMSFFDTTPHGRLINRFARDINTIDSDMPYSIDYVLACLFLVLGTVCVIVINIPKFVICMVPFTLVYILLQNLYINASQKLKRLECVSKSPIFSDFEESIQGITSIRSYDMDTKLMGIFGDKVDENITCSYHWYMCSRWLSVCIDGISVIIILATVLLSLNDINELTTSNIGLSLVYALTVTDSFTWLIRTFTDFQNQIISVERVEEYSALPSEAAWIVENEEIPENWPEEGHIAFHKFSACYRRGLDLALNNLSFKIAARQKVGIVGRTGAGKSSLTLALFRMIEAANGHITIDGIDISKIGLHTLRSKLTIIPQDPVLFTGSVRSNLDPNKEYKDADVWKCLERAHLKDYIASLPEGLEFQISEGGVNLSLGQRQLVCLARSLLKRTKILVLDEPTAAVDPETDHMIQETIRTEFKDCTVITIAHRLNTVMDYDIIIVMESGKVIEQGSPKDLMKNQNSVFYSMTRDAALM